ncbi:class I SAM-dependent RNA methyltransferase [Siccirubricoccus deserti]
MMPETLEITAIGAGGDGIAHTAAGSVFVPQALPGERVHARIAGQRAQVEEWLSESPDRIAPPCTHFPACGGCVLQHWAPAPYAEWKRARLVEALARAGFADAPVAPLVTTPPASRQRADLGLERLPDGRVQIGFHQRGTTALVPMRECHVLLPSLVALLPPLAEALRGLEGLRRLGSAVINMLASGPDILLRTDAPLTMPDRRALAALAQSAGIPRIAWAGKGRERRWRPSSARCGICSPASSWCPRRAPSCRRASPAKRRSSPPCWKGCRESCRRGRPSPTFTPGSARSASRSRRAAG